MDAFSESSLGIPEVDCTLGVEPELGVLLKRRARRRAISGVTARRSRSSSLTVWRDTPIAFASPDMVNP